MVIAATIFSHSSGLALSTPYSNPTFEEFFKTSDLRLKIRGVGLLRYMAFVKVYQGGLYLPEDTPSESVLSSKVPKRLEVEYFRSFRGKDFGPAARKLIERNVDSQALRILQDKIDLHSSFYEDVKPGDRYSLTYIPGKGTQLALNGTPKGTIKGAEFAAALFSIWLGTNPLDETFKMQLLGLK